MNSRGNLQRKCVKGHPKADGKCSGRCIRWYPRLELPRAPDGTRTFEALGGYPTRAQAEAALADALARRSHGLALDPAKLTVNQYLDRWLAHLRTNRRARTVARYTALLRDHIRPHIGARPLKQLTPLEIQAIYDRLAVSRVASRLVVSLALRAAGRSVTAGSESSVLRFQREEHRDDRCGQDERPGTAGQGGG